MVPLWTARPWCRVAGSPAPYPEHMESWPTFWCEPTGFVRVSLRVFTFGEYDGTPDDRPDHEACPAQQTSSGGYRGGHGASAVVLECAEARKGDDGVFEVWPSEEFDGNPLWPESCAQCGAPVGDGWMRLVAQDEWYKADGIGQWTERDLPIGAMYETPWLAGTGWVGDDDMSLTVVCPPGGPISHWHVDSQANNCTRPGEPHHCWCRAGDPRTEPVHVTKDCDTCAAGAGSIGIGSLEGGGYLWHGFLVHGVLRTA